MPTLNAKPKPIDITAENSALIVVDMQNAFASKGGMFDLVGLDISGAAKAIDAIRRLLDACRDAGVAVIYLQMSYRPDLSDAGSSFSPNFHKEVGITTMQRRPELWGKLLVEGTWDWQIVNELAPRPGDTVMRKSRYSGFCNTPLEQHLRERDIRHLLLSGVAANVCVESTGRDAYSAEFWPILVEDAVNHSGPDFNRQATLWSFEHAFGWVTRTDEVVNTLV